MQYQPRRDPTWWNRGVFFFFFAIERARGEISLWWYKGRSKSWGRGEKELTNLQTADKHRGEEEWGIKEWQGGVWKGKQSERLSLRIHCLWLEPDLKPELVKSQIQEPLWGLDHRSKLNPHPKTSNLDSHQATPKLHCIRRYCIAGPWSKIGHINLNNWHKQLGGSSITTQTIFPWRTSVIQ